MIFMSFYLLYSFRKKIFNKKTIITLIIIATITALFYYPLIKDKDFFAYDETDVKYYYGIVRTNEQRNYDFYATTSSIGYIYILMNLFWIFEIRNIFQTYNLIVVVMFFLFFIFNLMMYLFFKKRGFKRSDIILIIATIVTNMSFLLAIYRLKVVYFMVFLSILLSYFLLKRIEKTDNKLLNILFISNFLIGGVTRPEFVLYSLVFAFKYLLLKIKLIKDYKKNKNRLENKVFLTIFVFVFILLSIMFYYHLRDYSTSGNFWNNISFVMNNLNGENSAFARPIFFTTYFLILGLICKKTRIVTLLFAFLFFYQFAPSSFDIQILNFYCLIPAIIYFYENKGKQIIYFVLISSIIFNASIIAFSPSAFYDGKYILNLFDRLNQNEASLYVENPTLFYKFLFKDSKVIVYPRVRIYELVYPRNDYLIDGMDNVNNLVTTGVNNLKFELIGPVSFHDSTSILIIYKYLPEETN